jgi:2-polyprenyl-3-methyl-5-hydroxy-6-metoxy-1,4-benzoquinol methylase
MSNSYVNKIYVNKGNQVVLDLLPSHLKPKKILDVGIGNGANTLILKKKFPDAIFHGTTLSDTEMEECKSYYDDIRIEDITRTEGRLIDENTYDLVIISHILEHLPQPDKTIEQLFNSLNTGGVIIGAVPNVLVYNNRVRLFRGQWNYTETGIMDVTHLKFFTYKNIQTVLQLKNLEEHKFHKYGDTRVPGLVLLSKIGLSGLRTKLDRVIGQLSPNLFGWQIAFCLQKNK